MFINSKEVWKNVKASSDYGLVLDMPRESQNQPRKNTETEEGVEDTHDVSASRSELEAAVELPAGDAYEYEAERPKPTRSSIFNPVSSKPGMESSESSSGTSKALALVNSGQQFAITQKKTFMSMPKPQWHPPWKLYRVISGHLGWVRCIDVDPSNEWFVTGATDRIIKVRFNIIFLF